MAWEPDYATSAELKAYLRIDDDVDNAQIASALAAASRAIDQHCHRQFGKVAAPELRSYTAVRCGTLVVIDDLMTVAGIVIEVDGVAVTPDRYWPLNAPQKGRPWTRLHLPSGTSTDIGAVEITASWGWTAVPGTIKEAALLQASRVAKRRDSPFGVAGSPELGSEIRLLAKVDADVAVMLQRYVRRTAVG